MNNKLKPAVIGGVVLGLLSAIPFVNFVNICCCAWAILGGLLASYLYIKNSSTPATAGDGAVIGAIAGAIGAVIYLVIGIPLAIVAGAAMREAMVNLRCDVRFRSERIIGHISPCFDPLAIQSFLARESTLFRIVLLVRHV